MSTINDGGPAFPNPGHDNGPGNFRGRPAEGMTLRDYFAANAMAALIAEPEFSADPTMAFTLGPRTDDPARNFAVAAYRVADAMLAAREVTR